MEQLSQTDLDKVLSILCSKRCDTTQAKAIGLALRVSFAATDQEKRASFRKGMAVRIDFKGDVTYGTIIRVSRKTVTVDDGKGRLVRATHCLVREVPRGG